MYKIGRNDSMKTISDGVYSNAVINSEIELPLGTKVGYLVSSTDGSLIASTNGQYAVFSVEGKGYKTIRFMSNVWSGNYGYGFFLSDNTWQGTKGTGSEHNHYITVEVPDNAVEFRACWSLNYVTEKNYMYATIEQTPKEYVDGREDKRKIYPFDFGGDLSIIQEPAIIGYQSHSLADFYALYDGLVSSYPDYIQKVDCSEADSHITASHPSYLTSSLPIYLYKFCPTKVASYGLDCNDFVNVMIVTGLHSNEKLGMYVIYYMMKKICEDWKANNDLSQLRKLVNFYVIPCLNPWGFVNAGHAVGDVAIPGRCNGNGVNLNRNFPTANWYLSGAPTDSDGNYTGASAGSEYETQICMYYADLYDVDIFHDAHTGNMNVHGAFGVIDTYDKKETYNAAIAVSRGTTTQLVRLDENFPNNGDLRLIDVGASGGKGEAFRWAFESITPYSWLSEQSVESKFSDGVLTTNVVESDSTSARIWQMNLVAQYNLLLSQLIVAVRNN